MLHYIILARSLTYAQRTARTLEHAGITAIVTRPPAGVTESNCAYCVKIREKSLSAALTALNQAGLNHGRIYLLRNDGRTEAWQ